jgi:outer membrane protein OmpA-like peptidoglycan-associated protein
VRKITQWCGAGGLAIGLTVVLAGCTLPDFGSPAAAPSIGPPVLITHHAVPSALVSVLSGAASGPALTDLVKATARPREDLAVLEAGTLPKMVVSSVSPAPPTVRVAGRPTAPSEGETSYQTAQYADRVKHWRVQVAAGRRTEDARMTAALSMWLRGLGLPAKTGELVDPPGPAGSLAGESSAAASALVGLEDENGNVFGGRRVILLYARNLTGRPPVGELTGDTVLVVTPYLATAASASAAQADLLAAGAAQAAVVGPEVTRAQLAGLVSAGLRQGGAHESVSAPVLFANASASLSRRAVAELTALLPQMSERGVTAVINGFASVPGTALDNYTLSYQRAIVVASFLEAHGIPTSALIIVGHGASDLVAAGGSGQNRRVTVVIDRS